MIVYLPCYHTFCRWKKKASETVESVSDALKYVVYGTRSTDGQPSTFTRTAVLEARAAKRASAGALAFLPLTIFIFGFTLGMFRALFREQQ